MHRLIKQAIKKFAVITLILSLSVLTACSRTPGEEAIYQLVEDGVSMAESHDLGGMINLLEDGFIAGPGNHSKQEVRRILFVMLKRYGKFRILYPRPSIQLSDDEQGAIVKMTLLIASKQQPFPELDLFYSEPTAWLAAVDKSADLYTLSMELGIESGEWLLRKARITGFTRPHGRL